MASGINSFILPSIGSSEMSRDDQGSLIVNQATANILCCYLDHCNKIFAANSSNDYSIHPTELPGLINNIQDALKSF